MGVPVGASEREDASWGWAGGQVAAPGIVVARGGGGGGCKRVPSGGWG